ncbi:UNVERIFIED_CONTAM: hypothetical protein GTU68_014609 [Idotea baltica]|nr:hypothetical protein [Idotea baltica]
MRVPENLI